jgi:hypothetical protein
LAFGSVITVRVDGDLHYSAAQQHGHQGMTGFVVGDEFGHPAENRFSAASSVELSF